LAGQFGREGLVAFARLQLGAKSADKIIGG
jgi:hypothetical protein